ncbi:MAG: class I SAM-dependent methyltransferase, partial [Cyclobacteriaceae bacterium]
MPTQDGVMCQSYKEAKNVDKGNVGLRYCSNCGYIGNEEHQQSKVKFDHYDFSLDHSPMFREFVQSLCNRLVNEYSLNGKVVLDIGCGEGQFLLKLCELAQCRGIGIDPGFDHTNRNVNKNLKASFFREYYGVKHRDFDPDMITCRLVLDLLSEPMSLLRMIRKNLAHLPESVVYFEVPDASYTFRDRVIWNVVYEHRSWFTRSSFKHLFKKAGFEVLKIASCWNDEYLGIEARPSYKYSQIYRADSESDLHNIIMDFARFFQTTKTNCQKKIQTLSKSGNRVIGWGAGARAVTFFNLFNIEDLVPHIVDINVKRQGKFLPGSGQGIVAPKFLERFKPDTVIITNPTYAEEIKKQV